MNILRPKVFGSEEEIDCLLEMIGQQRVNNEEFTHREHLAFAAATIFQGTTGSLERIKSEILALNKANRVEQTATGGYHETLTVAWHSVIAAHLASLPAETPRRLAVNSVLHALADKQVILRHYSRDLIMSWQARTSFVEPDLAPLPEVEQ